MHPELTLSRNIDQLRQQFKDARIMVSTPFRGRFWTPPGVFRRCSSPACANGRISRQACTRELGGRHWRITCQSNREVRPFEESHGGTYRRPHPKTRCPLICCRPRSRYLKTPRFASLWVGITMPAPAGLPAGGMQRVFSDERQPGTARLSRLRYLGGRKRARFSAA